jgi:transcriptional regulator with XRE-family HTH domain
MAVHRRAYPNLEMFFRKSGMSQRALAKRVGVDPTYISAIRNGRRVPSLTIAAKIAEVANIPIESLLKAPRALSMAS